MGICVNVPLKPQPELRKTIEANYSDELMQIKSAEYSAAGIGVSYQISQHSVIVLYDSDGNKIKHQENHYTQYGEWLTVFSLAQILWQLKLRSLESRKEMIAF